MAPRTDSLHASRQQCYRYLPPDISMAAIRHFARRIAEKFDPDKIIVFGSSATAGHTRGATWTCSS